MNAEFKVHLAGPAISVQDRGRRGHQRYGVTGSGAMDRDALTIANMALGNSPDNAALEISLGGIALECTHGSVTACIIGGAFSSTLNNENLPSWSVFTITAGDKLSIRAGTSGSWCYLAFAGNIESAHWLGSQSVHLNSGICGKPLLQGDTLTIQNVSVPTNDIVSIDNSIIAKPNHSIRVVIGPQQRFFSEDTINDLLTKTFTISTEYDRMGMRLNGCTLPINAKLDMPSEPLSRGSIQVPGHGDPTCLLADHQTAGGYPKIATIISADQDVLVQHRSGDAIKFESVDAIDAVKIARDKAKLFNKKIVSLKDGAQNLSQRLWTSNLISGTLTGHES